MKINKEKPYVIYMAEVIYKNVIVIKNKNPSFSNIDAIEGFIGTDAYKDISSGRFHDNWFDDLSNNNCVDFTQGVFAASSPRHKGHFIDYFDKDLLNKHSNNFAVVTDVAGYNYSPLAFYAKQRSRDLDLHSQNKQDNLFGNFALGLNMLLLVAAVCVALFTDLWPLAIALSVTSLIPMGVAAQKYHNISNRNLEPEIESSALAPDIAKHQENAKEKVKETGWQDRTAQKTSPTYTKSHL